MFGVSAFSDVMYICGVSLRSFDISLVLFVLLACKSCWFLLVALVLVVKCSVYLVLLWGWGLA